MPCWRNSRCKRRPAAEAVAALSAEKTGLRDSRRNLAEQENKLRKERREHNEAQHREEIKIRDFRFQIAALEKRMEEEYQLVLQDVVTGGFSARAAYQQWSSSADRSAEETISQDELGLDELDLLDPPLTNAPARTFDGKNARHTRDRNANTGVPAQGTPPGPGSDSTDQEIRDQIEARVERLRRKLKHMGSVNTDSLHDLDELESRYGRLRSQLNDLSEAKNTLGQIIDRINNESRRMFLETFESVREHFRSLFRKAFGGGDGDIVLEDPNDILECGIDIVARPPGKELKSISLMSGGEKTLTALALLLALFKSRPSPYCVLDEVDAALDEANVTRVLALLGEFKQNTQFILITHKKLTMTIADTLYGVTMEESGVSKRMSVRFEDVRENGEICTKPSAGRRAATGANRRETTVNRATRLEPRARPEHWFSPQKHAACVIARPRFCKKVEDPSIAEVKRRAAV